jgi:hypothetical protein
MPLTCELGWHRADPLARWNDGYYFSKCTRCGRDLVRTAYQRWHVPKGYKVVWQAHPPEPRRPAMMVADAVGAAAPSPAPELPIQEVLRHLETRDLSNDGGVGCEDEEPQPLPPPIPDDVHLGTVRVSEVHVDQLLVSGMQLGAAPEESGDPESGGPEGADPELPFEEPPAPPETEAEAEAPPAIEEPEVEEAEAPAPAPAMQAPVRRSAADDFMADSSDLDFWEVAPRRAERQAADEPSRLAREDGMPGAGAGDIPILEPVIEDGEYGDTPRFQQLAEDLDSIAPLEAEAEPELEEGEKRHARPSFLSAFARSRGPRETEEQAEAAPAGSGFSLSGRLAVASLAAAALLMLASLVARPPEGPEPVPPASALPAKTLAPPPAAAAAPARADAPMLFPERRKAFVTARILNCRASPVEEAGSVKKLSRGAEVEVLAREADWMSISHDGRQCWAAVRYISPDRPA